MKLVQAAVLAAATLTLLAGCSSLKGRRVNAPPDPTKGVETAAGVSYYLARPAFEIQRKTRREGKAALSRYDLVIKSEPDPDQRYEVGMSHGLFTSDELELTLTTDGRLEKLNSSRADETGDVIAGALKLAAELAPLAVALSGIDADSAMTFARKEDFVDDGERQAVANAIAHSDSQTPTERESAMKAIDKARKGLLLGPKKNKDPIRQLVDKLDQGAAGARLWTIAEFEVWSKKTDAQLQQLSEASGTPLQQLQARRTTASAWLTTKSTLGDRMKMLAALDKLRGKLPIPSVAKAFAALRLRYENALSATLPPLIAWRNATDSNEKKKWKKVYAPRKKELDDSIAAIQTATRLVLDSDEKLHGRMLKERKRVLIDLLKTEINLSLKPTELFRAYAELTAELQRVQTVIGSIAPLASSNGAKGSLPATDVTSAIESALVHVDRLPTPLGTEDRDWRLVLAAARIRAFDDVGAVVIAYPQD